MHNPPSVRRDTDQRHGANPHIGRPFSRRGLGTILADDRLPAGRIQAHRLKRLAGPRFAPASISADFPPDLDLARPKNLRYLAHEFDGEQAVRQVGISDLDVVRKLEALLEWGRSDAAVQELPIRPGFLGSAMLAFDQQQVSLGGNRQLVFL